MKTEMMNTDDAETERTPLLSVPAAEDAVAPAAERSETEPVATEPAPAAPPEPRKVFALNLTPPPTKPLPPFWKTSAEPAQQPSSSSATAEEKARYWRKILTGNPDTVPEEVRRRAGADDASEDAEERQYRLLSSVNRSWAADFLGLPRETVAENWEEVRAGMAQQMGVAQTEEEVFTGLSDATRQEERQQRTLELFNRCYEQALAGRAEAGSTVEQAPDRAVRQAAERAAEADRRRLNPQVEETMEALRVFRGMEGTPLDYLLELRHAPSLLAAVDAVAEMEEEERARLYYLLQERLKETPAAQEESGLLAGVARSLRRGQVNITQGVGQFLGNGLAAGLESLAHATGSETVQEGSAWVDRRLRVIEELRRVAQGTAYPIRPTAEAGLAGQLLFDAAEATPSALLVMYGGGMGMAAEHYSSLGNAFADARQRAPKGGLTAQLCAGVVADAMQNNISDGMTEVGKAGLERTLNRFIRAGGSGVKGYAVAGLKSGLMLTGELLTQLLAEKATEPVGAGVMEAAARLEGTASNIDWRSFGEDVTDCEANLRESARLLPMILLASGKSKLHHFRSEHAVLGDGGELRAWGVPQETVDRIMAEPDRIRKGEMLHRALAESKRWSNPSFFPEIMKAMKLLHTDSFQGFREEQAVRDFLDWKPAPKEDMVQPLDTTDAKAVEEAGRRYLLPEEKYRDAPQSRETLKLMDSWAQKMKQHADAQELRPPALLPQREQEYQARRAAEALQYDSYRFLLNSFSYRTLQNLHSRNASTEKTRQNLLGALARSVMARGEGMEAREADAVFGKYLAQHYVNKRNRSFPPRWMRRTPRPVFEELHITALRPSEAVRGKKKRIGDEHLTELFSMTEHMQKQVAELARVLPQTEPFQSLLSRGCTVPQAYAHSLHRLLGFQDTAWMPEALRKLPEQPAPPDAETLAALRCYGDFTGIEPESTTGADGQTLWRVQRPDGRFTPWHATKEQALHDLSSHLQLKFLNTNAGESSDAAGYRHARLGDYEKLSRQAVNDLTRFWMEDATLLVPGVRPGDWMGSRAIIKTDAVGAVTSRDGQKVQLSPAGMATPYSLMKNSLMGRWIRLFNSGVADGRETAEFLVRRGALTREEADALIQRGEPRLVEPPSYRGLMNPAMLKRVTREHGSHVNPYVVQDRAGMHQALAEKLTQYSMGMYLSRLNELPLPHSVREWFATAPFYRSRGDGQKRLRYDDGRGASLLHAATARDAATLAELAPEVRRLREQRSTLEAELKQDPFYTCVESAMFPDTATRLEQGWSYTMGGADALHAAPLSMHALLHDPVAGWKRLPESRRNLLREHLEKEGEAPLEERLEQLQRVLTEYPELRSYGLSLGEKRLVRLEMEEPNGLPESNRPSGKPLPSFYPPGSALHGVRVLPAENLPPEMAADARVLPALELLHGLRQFSMDEAYATEDGIFRQGKRVGGADGLRPSVSMHEEWEAHRPLEGLLSVLDQVHQGGGSTTVGGVELPGLPREVADHWLRQSTVYRRNIRQLETTIVRLMPGELNAPLATMQRPYVVHSVVGEPLHLGGLWRGETDVSALYQPLFSFAKGRGAEHLRREYAAGYVANYGLQYMRRNYEELLRRTQSAETLESGRFAELPNRELLLQMAEDTHFSYTLENRSPQELSPAEARLASLFHAMLRYEFGTGAARSAAAADVQRLSTALREQEQVREDCFRVLEVSRFGSNNPDRPLWNAVSGYDRRFAKQREKKKKRKLHLYYDPYADYESRY